MSTTIAILLVPAALATALGVRRVRRVLRRRRRLAREVDLWVFAAQELQAKKARNPRVRA